jgi:hypothetical protein
VIDCHVAELRKSGYNSLAEWLAASPRHVYIGRDLSNKVKGAIGSKWQNKRSLARYGEDALRLFEQDIKCDPTLMSQLDELQDCILGCWCRTDSSPADREICHGDVLLRLLRESHSVRKSENSHVLTNTTSS